jgi:hypothetical protein
VAVALDDAIATPLGARREALETFSSSMSAPRLLSALAMADSSTFSISFAPFFG